MRKILVSLMVVSLCAGISGVSFAQKEIPDPIKSAQHRAEVWKGKVVSIDNAKNEITIQLKSGAEKTFKAESKLLVSLKQGQEVKISLQLGSSNIARNIKVVSRKLYNKNKRK